MDLFLKIPACGVFYDFYLDTDIFGYSVGYFFEEIEISFVNRHQNRNDG